MTQARPEDDLSDLNEILQPLLDDPNSAASLTVPVDVFDPPSQVPEASVEVKDLKEVYDKTQKKTTATGSEQRIADGVVHMVVKASAQLRSIRVFVRRVEEAAQKTNDTIGAVELSVQINNHEMHKTELCVNLDSVYKTPSGSFIYWLDRVEVEDRNRWELVIFVEFIDGTNCSFQSNAFRIRTKPRATKKPDNSPFPYPSPHESDQTRSDESTGPSSKRKRMQSQNQEDHGYYDGRSTPPRTTEALLTDYLEAQRASIKELHVKKMICTPNADIAYHVELKGPYYRSKDQEEGDVVGFFEQEKTGKTVIALLTHDNAREARMAGVISRSAYLQGNVPSGNLGMTDTVCVIGIVRVKVTGPVQNGERVYASLDQPGLAVPETQIPLRRMAGKSPILLGQTLESRDAAKMSDVSLVKCFVSIVMGIQSRQMADAVSSLQDRVHNTINDAVKSEKKRFVRGLIWKSILVLVVLGLLAVLLYEFLMPGSALRYFICKRGSIRPQRDVFFTYETYDMQTPRVHGIEFTWANLKKNMGLTFRAYNRTGMHFYLNLDRCAYGGVVMVGSLLDHKKQVRGAEVFAVNSTCSGVYYEMGSGEQGQWHPYTSARDFVCIPPYN
ncbi:predicted protein [Nematostella vectensis]|uniref:Uncharacterized protein n=1 Tax=Nematostella vectensis TaxID=45351 RepID=A7SYN4_NEMVE|nr:predicted protein [Nematostella vectensis]|eukprot:XP_001623284.1 predicted protein [Nematostella vectensis]